MGDAETTQLEAASDAALLFVLGPGSFAALAFEHANRQPAQRVHHLVDQLGLSTTVTAPLLSRLGS
jgi:hypothetical protein